jgi:hypothetical protein
MCKFEHSLFTKMKNWNGWKNKMEEENQIDEHNLFTTKGYVLM